MSRLFLAPALGAVLVLVSTAAFAQTSVTSTIPPGTTVGQPTFNRGTFSTSFCDQVSAGGTGSSVAYRAIPFTVTAGGSYTISTQYQAGFDGVISLYQGSFNPAASCTNRIANNDDVGRDATRSLIPFQTLAAGSYVLVVTGHFNTDAGTYTGTIDGPAAVSFPATTTVPPGTTVGQPTFNRGIFFSPCEQAPAGGDGTDVAYRAIPFTVSVAGSYTITTQYETGFDGYINLYQGGFDPAASCTNRIAFNDDFDTLTASQIANQALAAGGYVLVVTGYGNTHAGTYTGTIFGPAAVSFPVVQAGLYNPGLAGTEGTGAGFRLLGAPVAGLTPTSLAALNLVQGIAAGTNAATHPAQYPLAGANLFTGYTGLGYTAPDADDPLVPGRGFFWNLYDRAIASSSVPASFGGGTSSSRELTGFQLSAAGVEATANVSVAFADNVGAGADNFQMLANPFARPFRVSGITTTGGILQGGDVVQAYNPAGRTFVTLMGSTGARLAVWQGVFAELVPTTAGGAVTVTYAFASTDVNAPPTFYGRGGAEAAARPSVRFALAGTLADGTVVADSAAIVRFDGAAEAGWDALDASKLTPPVADYAMLAPVALRDGQPVRLAVDTRATGATAVVPVAFTSTAAGRFTLAWTTDLPAGTTATLFDAATGRTVSLDAGATLAFETTAAGDWAERFTLTVTPARTTAGEDGAEGVFALSAARPNPASGRATLTLTLDRPQHVRAVLVDALGRTVAVLHDGEAAGVVSLAVDAGGLAPGLYVVRVAGAEAALTRRITVAR